MSFQVCCPTCNASFNVGEQHVGKKAKCPKCENPFVIKLPISDSASGNPTSSKKTASPSHSTQASPPPLPADSSDMRMARRMKGQILDFAVQTNSGMISGVDGARYTFAGSEWKGNALPAPNMQVDFEVQGNSAVGVCAALGNAGVGAISGSKSKVAAGLLAFFLGGLGAHKFYLGYTGPGLVFLLLNTVGIFFTIWLAFIPNLILGLIAFIECIIYLTKSDEDFDKTYVVGRRLWF